MNAEFQRIVRKDKKPFLSEQCKEIEENNRMGRTRDSFMKFRDTSEHFMHDGKYKEQKGQGTQQKQKRLRSSGKYTQKNYTKKVLMTWIKCYTQYVSKFGKLRSGYGTGKISLHSNLKKGNAKECLNYCTIAFISHARKVILVSKVMLKILQARLQQYVN